MNYTDFTIRARDWEDRQFKVEVTNSPVDRMREPAVRTYHEAGLARPLRNLEHKRIRCGDLIRLGESLAEMLLPPPVREMLVRSLDLVGPDGGLRLRLELDAPPVANLPWEYLYLQRTGGEKTRCDFLALDPHLSLARHEAMPLARGSVKATRPLKLVVGFSSPSDAAPLDLETERGFIAEALDDIDGIELSFVEGLTVEKLQSACRGAHIFHFAGHGGFAPGSEGLFSKGMHGVGQESEAGGDGVILLQDAEGRSHPFPAENLALTLRGAGVRLAVLCACETGRRDRVNVWSGVAPALMRANLPAVVAMQYEIYDDSAEAFARRFYEALALGLSLDEAVAAGRVAILNRGGEDDVDWGIPVLYMRSPDGVIFPELSADPSLKTARDRSRLSIDHGLGDLICVQTDAIHSNVYGDVHQHQVQIYVTSQTGRGAEWHAFIDENTPPYKFLSPYTARDRVLFKGRDAEIRQVIRRIGEQRLLVIYGQGGVGKTSLLAAGVIPTLTQCGALVVHLQEYTQPLEDTIREGLSASVDQIPISLPRDLALPALVSSICETTGRTLVLVLDQFERLFEPSGGDEKRAALIESLAEALQAVEAQALRLVIAVQASDLERLGELQDRLPELLRSPIQLLPLNHGQAKSAIEDPLMELGYPVSFVAGLVDEFLVPDLDDLTPQAPGLINPPHLQIVCHWLYQAACERRPPTIDTELYVNQAKGADGILARYLEETLRTRLADQRALARRVLGAMASPGVGRWVPPERLPSHGIPPERLRAVLERLIEAELLISRLIHGRCEYAFTSQSVAQEVRRLAGPEVERRYQAGDELEHIWRAWLARDALASRGQLRYLTEVGRHLRPKAVKALLLLRSALARDEPASPWLARLRSDEGRALIRQLEEPDATHLTRRSSRSDMNKAALLLGLPDVIPPDRPEPGRGPFGPVSWSAVSHPEPTTRQTAALALTALEPYPQAALDRLRWALVASAKGRRHWVRQSELRGSLVDAHPDNKQLQADLSWMGRLGMWLWRARRRVTRNRHRLAGQTVGGAIGAGLALGLLRMVTGGLARRLLGIQFAMYFWWAWILGAALTLGMALGGLLALGQPEESGETPAIWQAPLHPHRLPALLAVGLGSLFFGIAHVLVLWFNGEPQISERLLMGFAAGLGLSLALYAQPRAGWHLGIGQWLLRLGTAALAFSLIQGLFVITGDRRAALAIGLAGTFFKAELGPHLSELCPRLVAWCPRWFDYLALIDAALAGIVLSFGITAGLLLAENRLSRWRGPVNRGGD